MSGNPWTWEELHLYDGETMVTVDDDRARDWGVSVYLPHQCDSWHIVEAAVSPAAAAVSLRAFIGELAVALSELEAMT